MNGEGSDILQTSSPGNKWLPGEERPPTNDTHPSRIYIVCPDLAQAVGGIKVLYHHVDILNRNGIDAFILHERKGFKAEGFLHDTRIAYNAGIFRELTTPVQTNISRVLLDFLKGLVSFIFLGSYRDNFFKYLWAKITIPTAILRTEDIVVIPEFYGPLISHAAKGCRKVIFNQNAHYSFGGYSMAETALETPYSNPEVLGTLVISDQNKNYLKYVFPEHYFHRNHYGINMRVFSYGAEKKKQVAFMIRKIAFEVEQVVNLIKFRGALKGFNLVIIDNMDEHQVAQILKESLIFLSFCNREGCALPPMEAMACGCIVIGYDGFGGKEYFKEEFTYPVPEGDSIAFAKAVEQAIQDYYDDPDSFLVKGRMASEFIANEYSEIREEEEILGFWDTLSARHGLVLK